MGGDHKHFKCPSCGGELNFSPGVAVQRCAYCSHEIPIPQSEAEIRELDFHTFLADKMESEETEEQGVVSCRACGSSVTFDEHLVADQCPYCGSSAVTAGGSTRTIKPKSLLPFRVTTAEAQGLFRTWIASLWFAPGSLKKYARVSGRLSGIYVPYWTYDADTMTHYTGERGDDYYVTEHYTATVNGRTVNRTRQVRKTRWSHASGVVWEEFDDVLVLASSSLPREYADNLEPWDLENLEPYQDEFLNGFRAERYQVNLEEGMESAKVIMQTKIEASICADIGGDHQRISSSRTQYDNITFKHILLPVWLAAYNYRAKVFRFLVNARTGEVQGERPYSWVKITLAVLAAVGSAAALFLLFGE